MLLIMDVPTGDNFPNMQVQLVNTFYFMLSLDDWMFTSVLLTRGVNIGFRVVKVREEL